MGDDLTGLEDGQKYQWKKNKVKITVKKILNLRIWQINFGKFWDSTAFHHCLLCLERFSLLLFMEEAEQLRVCCGKNTAKSRPMPAHMHVCHEFCECGELWLFLASLGGGKGAKIMVIIELWQNSGVSPKFG